jgi:beta-aspartyl-peptidase (threonine type)
MTPRSSLPDGWVLAVHGGAGDGIVKLPHPRLEAAGRALEAALNAGAGELRRRGSAVQAVVSAVKVLEDSPEFNAARGAVLTREGTVETDAAVADGRSRRAAGVAACRCVRNPVEAARTVLERTDNVLLVGDAVVEWAKRWGLEIEEPDWFITDHAVEQLHRAAAGTPSSTGETVGAVARDLDGHLAAATSTGGRVGQLAGRVGDSPVVGAGLWADDRTCAVSATGQGEMFLLTAFAHEIDALMRLSGLDIGAACQRALEAVSFRGARGGCIAVDAAGTVVMPFTTAGMYRGWTDTSGDLRIEMLSGS